MNQLYDYLAESIKPVAIYVHGYKSNKNSTTFQIVKNHYSQYRWISADFDLTHPYKCMNQVKTLVKNTDAELLIGSSFGAFYVLHCDTRINKIVINPCFDPDIHVVKLDKNSLDDKALHEIERIKKTPIDDVFGIFGDHDELFSYADDVEHMIFVSGGHRLTQQNLISGMDAAMSYYNINESLINEHFVNIFVQRGDSKNKELIDRYKDQVWDILYNAYRNIEGRILGIDNIDDLIDDSELWKLVIRNDKVLCVFIYNFKRGGRKIQYIGKIPGNEARNAFMKVIEEDTKLIQRKSYVEASGKPEEIYMEAGMTPIPADIAQLIMKDKQFLEIDDDGYHYWRIIGSMKRRKMMLGNIEP